MRIRRCGMLLIEPRERVEFDLDSLLDGGNGMRTDRQWIALAPHLERECCVSAEEVVLLGTVPSHEWTDRDDLFALQDRALVDALIAKGLLIGDAVEFTELRERDEALRASHWYTHAGVVHAFGRWHGIAAGERLRNHGIHNVTALADRLGAPPPHFHSRCRPEERLALGMPEPSAIDALLRRRALCRNFETSRSVPFAIFSQMLHRTFGAQATHAVNAETAIVKKTSPSAGGLHPTEAYLLIQHVENVAPGLYHYHVGDHALEPLQPLLPDEALAMAGRFVAEQEWFAGAHAMVVLAPRFARNYWKYRNHAKSYRAVTLDVGHLSQMLQLSATDLGLGAFVTAAINEVDIEEALGLQPMQESPLAVCGFGWRSAELNRMELDPLHAVWPAP